MHLLPTSAIRLDDGEDAVDLALAPADLLVLSFADSDLAALSVAAEGGPLSVRLASMRRLKHPFSIDLLIEKTLPGTRFVLLRCLGGLDYWRYGVEQIAAACRTLGIALAVLPGCEREDDRLAEYGTIGPEFAAELLGYFRAGGGAENMRRMIGRVAQYLDAPGRPSSVSASPSHLLPRGEKEECAAPVTAPFSPRGRRCRQAEEGRRDEADLAPIPLPAIFALDGQGAPLPWRDALADLPPTTPLVPILLYRSGIVAGDTAMATALAAAVAERGLAPLPLALTSLKDAEAVAELHALIDTRKPGLIVTTTAFSARDGESFVLDRADCPILQAVPVGSPRKAWEASPRGLSNSDLAMQIALPEFDGRIGTIPVAFKQEETDPATRIPLRRFEPCADGVAALADLAAGWVRLAATPRRDRRLALVMSDYPARGGRAGFAVGLDTPASVTAIQELLDGAGYDVGSRHCEERSDEAIQGDWAKRSPSPPGLLRCARNDGPELMSALTSGPADFSVPLERYETWLAGLPASARDALVNAHGQPSQDAICVDGAFRFRVVRHGKLLVALQPPRDGSPDRKARYHDPDAPPGHAYLAFYLGLRENERIDALIHLGTHGTTEWLPGKAVALSAACWPRLATGALPVIYPYVVDDPGEAAPAKRRLGAVTLGHLPPPIMSAEASGETRLLRELVEEYSQAQLLDPRRAAIVAAEIRERAEASGLAEACGVTATTPLDEALTRLDAHLCDLTELAFRDGLHVFGAAAHDAASSASERDNLLRALDGRFVPPGPAGSPQRGRQDVLPTGRNLSTLDPRAIPSRAAARLGAKAAQAVIARHLQDHGDYPRRIVMDLWASPTLRSGGEDIAHALSLMGVAPVWDPASTRVTGFEILPQAKLDHPRLDVTIRISGAFRDTFPQQIALLDAAARAVAELDEPDEANEPAAARRRGADPARIFGTAPGRYGAATADRALDGTWAMRAELGEAFLAATSHAYGGAEGLARPDPGFTERLGAAQAFVHVSDTAGRDILEATSAADAIGGLAAAAERLGAKPALYSLDSSAPETPKARTLPEDISRIVHGRLTHPRWISGQLGHGWRGAAELAEALDTLFVFAATSDAAPGPLFEAVFQAWCGDAEVWSRIAQANPPAAASIRERLAEARRRGFWTSRRNSVDAFLEAAE